MFSVACSFFFINTFADFKSKIYLCIVTKVRLISLASIILFSNLSYSFYSHQIFTFENPSLLSIN